MKQLENLIRNYGVKVNLSMCNAPINSEIYKLKLIPTDSPLCELEKSYKIKGDTIGQCIDKATAMLDEHKRKQKRLFHTFPRRKFDEKDMQELERALLARASD